MEKFERKIKLYIESNELFQKNERLLLAVSGGRDSMVMLNVLKALDFEVVVAHVNYNLRGEDSDRDEMIVKKACAKMKIPFYCHRVDTKKILETQGGNLQNTAREIRYNWMKELLQTIDFQYIATAHHLNDNIETVLYNFQRGTGIRGMRGIQGKQTVFVRPLLGVSRAEIDVYVEAKKIEFGEDVSNSSDVYKRNFLRNRIIPNFVEMNPSFEQNAAKSIELAYKTDLLFQYLIDNMKHTLTEKINNELHLDLFNIDRLPAKEVLLYELISEYGVNETQCKDILKNIDSTADKVFLTTTNRLIIHNKYLIITKLDIQKKKYIIKNTSTFEKDDLSLSFEKVNETYVGHNYEIVVDAEKLVFPLTLRGWKKGENFQPFGMDGKHKKVSDLLNDSKLSIIEKERLWLLESDGKIVWVIGMRADQRFKIDSNSKEMLKIIFKKGN